MVSLGRHASLGRTPESRGVVYGDLDLALVLVTSHEPAELERSKYREDGHDSACQHEACNDLE